VTGWTRRDKKGGWLRLWFNGPGIAWGLKTQPKLPSLRDCWYLHVGRWRVRYLRRTR
jgi:hypothetical protein